MWRVFHIVGLSRVGLCDADILPWPRWTRDQMGSVGGRGVEDSALKVLQSQVDVGVASSFQLLQHGKIFTN